MCLCLCVCSHVITCGGRKRALDPLKLVLVSCLLTWMLGMELQEPYKSRDHSNSQTSLQPLI